MWHYVQWARQAGHVRRWTQLRSLRVHKVPLETVKVLVIGPGGREHAIVRSLLADPNVSEVHAAPGNAGISKLVPTHAIDANDPDAVAALATKLDRRPGGGRPRGAACRRRFRRRPRRRHPGVRPQQGRGPARSLQGLRQGGHGRGRRPHRHGPGGRQRRGSRRRARHLRRALRRQGRRPRRRQGRGGHQQPRRGPRARPELLRCRRHRRDRGIPGRPRGLGLRPLRRPQHRGALPGAGLQADLRQRRRPQHRRHGRLHPAGMGPRRPRPGGPRPRRPAHGQPDGPPRHPVRRRALRRPGPDVPRHPRHRVQRPLRRSRKPRPSSPGSRPRSAGC